MPRFNNETLTQETIELTKQFFIDNNKTCIEQATNGVFFVNDLNKYIKHRYESIEYYKSNECLSNFTFLQRAYFIQTGECLALLNF